MGVRTASTIQASRSGRWRSRLIVAMVARGSGKGRDRLFDERLGRHAVGRSGPDREEDAVDRIQVLAFVVVVEKAVVHPGHGLVTDLDLRRDDLRLVPPAAGPDPALDESVRLLARDPEREDDHGGRLAYVRAGDVHVGDRDAERLREIA